MIIKGNMNYDFHGRKRKKKRKSSNGLRQRTFVPLMQDHSLPSSPILEQAKAHREKYPSMPMGEYKSPVDNSYKKDISSTYTVSIPYNKGAYQVIPKDEVEHIGK
jgi:hypothetical protein